MADQLSSLRGAARLTTSRGTGGKKKGPVLADLLAEDGDGDAPDGREDPAEVARSSGPSPEPEATGPDGQSEPDAAPAPAKTPSPKKSAAKKKPTAKGKSSPASAADEPTIGQQRGSKRYVMVRLLPEAEEHLVSSMPDDVEDAGEWAAILVGEHAQALIDAQDARTGRTHGLMPARSNMRRSRRVTGQARRSKQLPMLPEEAAALEDLAGRAGLSVAALVERCILAAADSSS